MASGGKKRTTMAKITREAKLRERRADKEARKNARKQGTAYEAAGPEDVTGAVSDETTLSEPGPVELEPVAAPLLGG